MMGGILRLAVLSVAQIVQFTTAVFFHEPSSVLIRSLDIQNKSAFGFAMGYQVTPEMLVVGAPRADSFGKVFTCDMMDAGFVEEINCMERLNKHNFNALANYSTQINYPDQYFYAGSTIVATDEYFFTCAPLWTIDFRKKSGKKVEPDAFGTCFMYNDTATYRYLGSLERYIKGASISYIQSFIGGTGWSTLADTENELLLIAKTSLNGDILYTPLLSPINPTKSMVNIKFMNKKIFGEHWNIGFGITAGKFFSDKTVYAISMQLKSSMQSVISFLEYNKAQNVLSIMRRREVQRHPPYRLMSEAIGSMFGLVMGAADLNMDGKDELLVGAPAQSEEDCTECGALHIYLGGDLETLDDINRLRTILGGKELGRFGAAIATNDLDGDSKPELAVSAPYEDDGLGAVYILSGYDIYHILMNFSVFRSIQISELKNTQKIQKLTFRTLGFSLQFVNDRDNNGCSELVMSSPGSDRLLMFKCLQTINVTVTSELFGKQMVKEQDNNFTMKVCTRVELNQNTYEIIGNVTVISNIDEAARIPKPKFMYNIACSNCSRVRLFCDNVTVFLDDNDQRTYNFTSQAELHTEHIFKSKELNASWVVASPYSQLVKSTPVYRYCKDDDCKPELSLETFWSGSKKYVLGSSSEETVTIRLNNTGHESHGACVWLNVSGALIFNRSDCVNDNGGGYICSELPKPFKRNKEYSINITLNMQPVNLNERLLVEVKLHEDCDRRSVVKSKSVIDIEYVFITNDVYVEGLPHSRIFSYTQLEEGNFINDVQEFLIINNGSMTWKNIYAIITMEDKPFNQTMKVSAVDSDKCAKLDGLIGYRCNLTIMANSTRKIVVSTELLGSELPGNLYKGKLNTTSRLILYLTPTEISKEASVMTVMKFESDKGFGQNKLLIASVATLVAILILVIIILILYKFGFFRRKQKQRLRVLKDSIRRHSTRRPTIAADATDSTSGLPDMEVVEDSPFGDPIPITTNDDKATTAKENGQQ